jgi:hypothetical protein
MNKGEDADPPGKHNCRWPIPAAPLIKTLRCWRIHSPLAKACMVGLAKSAASAGGFDVSLRRGPSGVNRSTP